MEIIEEKKAVNALKRWVQANRAELLSGGIATIVAFYSGEGDEGCLDDYLELQDKDGTSLESETPEGLHELLEALHDDVAPAGYQDNEGGGGEFRLDVETGAITHEAYYLVVERSYLAVEEY